MNPAGAVRAKTATAHLVRNGSTWTRRIKTSALDGLTDLGSYGRRGDACVAQSTAALAGLAAHKVACPGFLKGDLTTGANLHPLGNTFVCLGFRHKTEILKNCVPG